MIIKLAFSLNYVIMNHRKNKEDKKMKYETLQKIINTINKQLTNTNINVFLVCIVLCVIMLKGFENG